MPNRRDPISGPIIRPIPVTASIQPIMASLLSGQKLVLTEYSVVYIRLDENPYKNRLSIAKVMKVFLFSISVIRPKTIKLVPIKNMPKNIGFLLPKKWIILPTNGLQNITAIEYTANMYPMQSWSISFLLNSKGKNGAIIAQALFASAVVPRIARTSPSIQLFFFCYYCSSGAKTSRSWLVDKLFSGIVLGCVQF